MKLQIVCTTSLLLLAGCASVQKLEPNVDRGYLKQTIQFDSTPSGALCDISSIKREEWLKIPEIVEHRKELSRLTSKPPKETWQYGIKLSVQPSNAKMLYPSVAMPASLKIERRSDALLVSCLKQGFERDIRAYVQIDNKVSSSITLFDPTWVVGDYFATETGVAYLYPELITVKLRPIQN